MVLIASGGGFHDGNYSNCWDHKYTSFTNQNCSENTNWETSALCMSVAEEAIRKAICTVNTPMEFWGCTKPPRYHTDRFHTYRNFPNKMGPYVA